MKLKIVVASLTLILLGCFVIFLNWQSSNPNLIFKKVLGFELPENARDVRVFKRVVADTVVVELWADLKLPLTDAESLGKKLGLKPIPISAPPKIRKLPFEAASNGIHEIPRDGMALQ